ncbi:hypothetical protein FRC05_001282 [Tulasnella sp. 425]|nr:hypothetical protein FRC05_001282 [Tulasnella sp. 425]
MSSNTSSSLKRMQGSASYVDDEIMSSLPAPPPSKRAKQSRPGPTDAQASHRIQDAARSSQADEWSTPYDFEDTISHSSFLGYIQVYHTELTVPFKKYLLKALSLDIRKGNPDNIKLSIKAINKWFASYPRAGSASEYDSFIRLQKEWKALLAEIQKPLPPSSFSRSSKWVHQQNGAAFINCLRPPECSGLPLNLLHPLFAEFLARIEGPPPDGSDPKFILAEQVATELCQEMPRHFDTEDGRLSEFVRIVTRLFKGTGSFSRQFPVGSGRADLVLQCTPVGPVLVGEGKNEPGGSCGDPYMQVAASYDAWAREVDEKLQIDSGCPCFVLCVDGPNILFGGGLRDNEVSVVEPLSDWCVMMPQVQLKRERVLARHLYALSCCLSDQSKFLKPLPSRTACCPRIYGAFIGLDSRESVPLQFIKPFKNPWHGRRGVFDLLFRASVKEKIGDDLPAKESSVLVKVPIGSTYGLEPHVLAASAGFAPRLLGTASVPGAPVIYVMELLSESEEWFHLVWYELPKHITERQKGHLRDRGTALTSFLSRNQLVHGDLRGCNVMCRLGDNDVDLRVLDWDWAGKQGAARYPVALNMEAGYQGRPGGLIEASHDEHMLRKTLDDLFVR